jgi:Flp pilus assembly protein TadD
VKALIEKAIKEDPRNEDAYELLGVVYARESQFNEAITAMKKLEELNPDSVMAKTNLSIFYMKIGDKETAEDYKAKATVAQFQEALKK